RGIKETILQKNHSIQNYRNQIKFLENFSVDGMGSAEGEKILLASKDSVSGLLGVVDTLLRVDENYKRPIETALGKRAGYLVFDTAENAIKAMSYLREIKGGKASMIPMDIAARKAAAPQKGIPTQDSRIVGKACDFVRYESEFGALASLLLSDTLIVRTDLADWFGTTNGEYANVNVVDLNGNMIDQAGYLIGGDGEYLPQNDLFDKDREIERLRKEIQEAEKEILDLENEKRSTERKIEDLVKNLSDATSLEKKLNSRREELERQFAVLDHEISKDQEFASRMKREKVQISLFQNRQEELLTVQVEIRETEDRKQSAEQRMEELRHVAAELEMERSERESERQEVKMALL
ncbi:MAG TPA: hypothetical protein VJC03_07135, partial [bacterium]|nr:hypothetical protein [bacterium]